MSVDPGLIEILACPNCRAEIDYDEAAATITCRGCGFRYPVRDDIPVMLIDEAEKPPTTVKPQAPKPDRSRKKSR
jgi:uncharacterized protein YbaR (Trm112 family)